LSSYKGRSKGSYGTQQRHGKSSFHGFGRGKHDADTLMAQRNFESRSKRSQIQDLHRFATIAPNIHMYLKSPEKYDWKGVDDPNILAKLNIVTKLAKKKPVHMVVKDGKAKKEHHFKIIKKSKAKKEPEKQELKAEANNPIKEEGSHKLPSEKEIYDRAVKMYQEENFKPKYEDSAPEVNPTKGELSEEGYLQKAKLSLMTSQDTVASRQTMDYIDNLRQQLEKIGFDIVPINGFSVEDLQY
jgi:hypothetical protein